MRPLQGDILNVFFVLGTPRSGTTLLGQALSAHTEIVVPGETNFFLAAASLFNVVKDPEIGLRLAADLIPNVVDFSHHLGEFISPTEAREIVLSAGYDLGAIIEALYAAVAAKAGKRLAGDKSPNELFSFWLLKSSGVLKRNRKVIHLVRDGRDSAESAIRQGWASAETSGSFLRSWSFLNLEVLHTMRGDPDYLLIRYEDMVADPRTAFEGICGFLGCAFEPVMLDPAARHPRYLGTPVHSRIFEPISTGRIGEHRRSVSPELSARWTEQAREGLVAFGYEAA